MSLIKPGITGASAECFSFSFFFLEKGHNWWFFGLLIALCLGVSAVIKSTYSAVIKCRSFQCEAETQLIRP